MGPDRCGPEGRDGAAPLFAARLRDDLGTRPALVLPYADPDLSALVATHLNRYFPGLIATATRVAADLPGHHRVDVAWPADGLIGGDRMTALTALYGAALLGRHRRG